MDSNPVKVTKINQSPIQSNPLSSSTEMSVIISIPIAARRAFRPVATATFCSSSPKKKQKQLILYSKAGCCLCDGLKEKLNAAFSLSGPHPIQLQVRNIMENPEWERLYQYEIPVLAKLLPDGTEETLPRLSPRLSVELIQKKITAALEG